MALKAETGTDATAALPTERNRSVFELPPFGEGCAAYCLYFYYYTDIHQDGQGNLLNTLRIYYHDNLKKKLTKKKVKKVVKKLVLNARRDMLRNQYGAPAPQGFCPPCCGEAFEDIIWRRQSYIVVVVDDPKWKLPNKSEKKRDAIEVTERKTCNHTFFQAFEWNVKMPPNAPNSKFNTFKTTAIAFRNHMVSSEAGSPLGTDEEQPFNFAIFVEDENQRLTETPIDPDGNNLGPPLPPP